jgi:hypothetical protein
MGFLDGLMGNASEVNIDRLEKDLELILCEGEEVERAYVVIRDSLVFTNRRLLLIDKQGLTGKKVEYHSVPYRSITHFSVETAGHFELDADLKIWISGTELPIEKEFRGDKSIYNVQRALAHYVLK